MENQGAPPRATGPGPTTAADVIDVVSRLRRVVRRSSRQDRPQPPLVDSEVELLRLVVSRPGLRVHEAAARLGLVSNTVSTMVGRLVSAGLLERRSDDDDGRVARLFATERAVRRMAAWRDRRARAVDEAIRLLPASDRDAVATAVPALRRLVEVLEKLEDS